MMHMKPELNVMFNCLL